MVEFPFYPAIISPWSTWDSPWCKEISWSRIPDIGSRLFSVLERGKSPTYSKWTLANDRVMPLFCLCLDLYPRRNNFCYFWIVSWGFNTGQRCSFELTDSCDCRWDRSHTHTHQEFHPFTYLTLRTINIHTHHKFVNCVNIVHLYMWWLCFLGCLYNTPRTVCIVLLVAFFFFFYLPSV